MELNFRADFLREEIRKNKLSQRKLAKLLGISEKALSQRMNGIREWKLSEIQSLKAIMPDMNTTEIFHI